jgi:tetratricopeptide (TPR) repeat protein
MNKKIAKLAIMMFAIIAILLYANYRKQVSAKGNKYKPQKFSLKSQLGKKYQIANFIEISLGQIDSNYRIGNNNVIEGFSKTKVWHNDYGDMTRLDLSNRFYTAKGYFEKMIIAIESFEDVNNDASKIKNILIKAAKMRIESIDLFTKGYYRKEQIGKLAIANAITALKGGSPLPIPQYDGEIEKGTSKILMANSYIVDALRLLKNMANTVYLEWTYDSRIADHISYYCDVSETDYDSYVEDAKAFSKVNNYFEAIINYNKALRVKPKDRDILLDLTQAYIGIGNERQASKTIEQAKRLYPNDKDFIEVESKIKPKKSQESLYKRVFGKDEK